MKKLLSILVLIAAFTFAAKSQELPPYSFKIDTTINTNFGISVDEVLVQYELTFVKGNSMQIKVGYYYYLNMDALNNGEAISIKDRYLNTYVNDVITFTFDDYINNTGVDWNAKIKSVLEDHFGKGNVIDYQ